MNTALTYGELASLMKSSAGLDVDAEELASRPDAAFADFGLDSLGLLGIVERLENGYGQPIGGSPESCKTPAEFVELVNSSLSIGA